YSTEIVADRMQLLGSREGGSGGGGDVEFSGGGSASRGSGGGGATKPAGGGAKKTNADDLDDDIPF
ncbi:MAG TPA: single-stranded DNA-binding protein, partial [Casimicrobiaceae bacterium]|nr:single-stranded DNA-binding protein [Casimicrobiaceae bacterium]